ncbi:hypothetical protein [Streptomyces sp. ISL-100]|uniref:hypothetical protein n=1 Tax=Streptomyces sp. ISL-100 TaxID=2819173 RepID=UPI001BE58625|nr:hypothetical protein [Streptomyces sp. ISL-100]MBT2398711.1 hypothetical protein [Streptomyces sp. ISL-100]
MAKTRPVDWSPLAEKDPVPGSPDEIRTEASEMRKVATMLRDQARAIKKMADDDELKGKTADKLREESGDLEKHLREVAGRYERVNSHLDGWANDLEEFQRRADKILSDAKIKEDEEAAKAKKDDGKDKDKQDSESDDDPYKTERSALRTVVSERDSAANRHARKIRDGIDDIIEDSWWESVVDYVKIAIDVLSWAATAIAVVALFITPVGWIAALAIGLTIAVAIGHTALAITGDGSWYDVGMDLLALGTFGMGKIALKGLKGVQAATRNASSKAAGKSAQQSTRASNAGKRAEANAQRSNVKESAGNKRGAKKANKRRERQERNAARNASRRERQREIPEASQRESVTAGGDKEFMSHYKDIQRMRANNPGNQAVQDASAGAERYNRQFRAAWGTGTAVDGADKAVGSSDAMPFKPSIEGYNDFKDGFTWERGSTW